ncbi:hypothetical protein [uncultured Microscilla sp.]|uniref:hypothetical protein n=1 Tax=uncultured Microscilla sp. TaxID=432653 RepID=UPI00262F8538|nr:hypothetical protein [uncultured Microscilla sp.]
MTEDKQAENPLPNLEEHPLLAPVDPEQHVVIDKTNIPLPKIADEDKEDKEKEITTIAGKKRKERENARLNEEQPLYQKTEKEKPKQFVLPSNDTEDKAKSEESFEENIENDQLNNFEFSGGGNMFADTAIGLIQTFLPLLVSNWIQIDSMEILKAEKQEIVPLGSFERVNKVNDRNKDMLNETISQGTRQIQRPLEDVLSKRSIEPGPEASLMMALGVFGFSTFSVARDIRKSNKAFLDDLIDIQTKKQKENKKKSETKK